MASRLLRTALYVPAASAKAVAKAPSLPADAVILDLEDSVAPEAKDATRAALAAALPMPKAIRINAPGTPWHEGDLDAAVAAGPAALLLPKASAADEIWALRRAVAMRRPAAPIALWAMIETPRGVLAAPAIAEALGPDGVLVLGLNDLAKETGMAQAPGRAPMQGALTMAVLAARAHGAGVLDGVFNRIGDAEGFLAECRQARAFGFDGKTLVHPSQIGPANEVFAPSEDEVREAEAIVAAFQRPENAGRGVVALDGRMVERLHREMAEALLERHRLAQAAAGPR